MFVKKDTRKIREIFDDDSDDKKELYLARRKFEFPNGAIAQTICQPQQIEKLYNLEYLSLYDNSIHNLSGIGQLERCLNLVELDLGCNKLEAIPAELGNLTSLESLACEDNQLSGCLSSYICQLSNLKSLRMSRNRIDSLPSAISNLKSIENLVLDGNLISELIPEVGDLTSLKELHTRGNKLTRLPNSVGNLLNLETLAISSNNLTEISNESMRGLHSLVTLYANGNCLKTLPGALADLQNLKTVSLANNEIEYLPPQLESWTPNEDGSENPAISVKIVFLGNPITNEEPYIDDEADP